MCGCVCRLSSERCDCTYRRRCCCCCCCMERWHRLSVLDLRVLYWCWRCSGCKWKSRWALGGGDACGAWRGHRSGQCCSWPLPSSGIMAEYVDGNEKAPLSSSAAGGKRAAQKPDWTRFGLSGGDGQPPPRKPGDGTLTKNDDDAGEVNEIYAEHEVWSATALHFHSCQFSPLT